MELEIIMLSKISQTTKDFWEPQSDKVVVALAESAGAPGLYHGGQEHSMVSLD
jgi:hypothetical protein